MRNNPSPTNIFAIFQPKPDSKPAIPDEVYGRGHRSPDQPQAEYVQRPGASAPILIPQPRKK